MKWIVHWESAENDQRHGLSTMLRAMDLLTLSHSLKVTCDMNPIGYVSSSLYPCLRISSQSKPKNAGEELTFWVGPSGICWIFPWKFPGAGTPWHVKDLERRVSKVDVPPLGQNSSGKRWWWKTSLSTILMARNYFGVWCLAICGLTNW